MSDDQVHVADELSPDEALFRANTMVATIKARQAAVMIEPSKLKRCFPLQDLVFGHDENDVPTIFIDGVNVL